MKRTILLVSLSLAIFCSLSYAQPTQPCFDLNQDGSTDIIDLVYSSDIFVGHVPLPAGLGDIDGRAGFNLGDSRYYTGWIFFGYPAGTCPPHPAYTILPGADTVYLGSSSIPAGDGQVNLPIVLKAINNVDDLLIPFHVTTTSGSVTVGDVAAQGSAVLTLFNYNRTGSQGIVQFSSVVSDQAPPGTYFLGSVTVNYSGSSGGTVSLDTTSLGESYQFPHYVYGDVSLNDYSALTIATPAVVTGSNQQFPTMSVAPDSMYYETLVNYPNPDPQSFTVQSDGGPFAWTLTATSWIQTSITSGISGQSVEVTPDITGMAVGTHHGTIVITSTDALGSPKIVDVYVKLKPQYPSFDANCDGHFSIADIVMQINYIFGNGEITCDPCTGQPNYKK